MAGDLDKAFKRVAKAAAATKLAGIEQGISYGTPALKVAGKLLARMYDAETLVLRCPLEDKELLFASAPALYFETDHYKGWPAILLRLAKADDGELRHGIARAWRLQAPKKLQKAAALVLLLALSVPHAAFAAGMGGGGMGGGMGAGGSHYYVPPSALYVPPHATDDPPAPAPLDLITVQPPANGDPPKNSDGDVRYGDLAISRAS